MRNILRKLVIVLNSPHPLTFDIKTTFIESAGLGILVFLILFLFETTDELNNAEVQINIFKFLSFGLVTFTISFAVILLLPRLLPKLINEDNWTTSKEIISIIFLLLLISLGNSFLFVFWGYSKPDLNLFFIASIDTLKIGFFPVVIGILIGQNRRLKRNLKSAEELNSKIADNPIEKDENFKYLFCDENNKNKIEILAQDLYFIKSAGNYVEIFAKSKELVKPVLLRCSLKSIEKQLSNSDIIIKCHRTYLVNILLICSVEGNSQGYKLKLKDCEFEIPVSRSYTKELKTHIKNLQFI